MKYVYNPITMQLEIVRSDNFSYDYIITGKTICIPENQQMSVHGTITVDGSIIIDGSLVLTD